MLRSTFKRELTLKYKTPALWLNNIVLFAIIVLVFVMAIGSNTAMLHDMAAAIVWVAVLFSILLGIDSLFSTDYQDGTLEQIIVSRQSVVVWVLAKLLSHWLTGGFLLTLLSVMTQPFFGLSGVELSILMMSLLLGTAIMTLFSAMVAALTLALGARNILLPLIALPLQLPVIIFSTGLFKVAGNTDQVFAVLAMLGAILILALILLPYLISITLKSALT